MYFVFCQALLQEKARILSLGIAKDAIKPWINSTEAETHALPQAY
jgi:hypothetical protein